MKLVLAPIAGGYMVYPLGDTRLRAGDVVCFESTHVAGIGFIESHMTTPGYMFIEPESARWMLRGCAELPSSHPLRCTDKKATATNERAKPGWAERAEAVLKGALAARGA